MVETHGEPGHTGFHIDEQSGSEGNDIDTGQSSPGRWEVTEAMNPNGLDRGH